MQTFHTTQTWGYQIHSLQEFTFYHILLEYIPVSLLYEHIPQILSIQTQTDGSITIKISEKAHTEDVIKKLETFFHQKSLDFFETPTLQYKIPITMRQPLLSWALSFEGCLAMLLLADKKIAPFFHGQWEYINASTGGLYLEPFTLLLYEDHPKIVHPITLQNFKARKAIEQTTVRVIRKMFQRISQAQKGLEGIALLSLVEEKTFTSRLSITKTINDKSFYVKAPLYSPFFSRL
jgi:hypothetical protein